MPRLSFSLRDVFWLTLVVAIGLGWWLEHTRLASYREIWGRHFGETPVRDNAFQQPWNCLDLRLDPISKDEFAPLGSKYKGGVRVTAVRPGSQAAEQGIRAGDILVGLHVWTTASLENVEYVLDRKDLESFQPLKVYLLRDKDVFFGHIRLASSDRSDAPVLPDVIPAGPDQEQSE